MDQVEKFTIPQSGMIPWIKEIFLTTGMDEGYAGLSTDNLVTAGCVKSFSVFSAVLILVGLYSLR
jgi:hypothetical protein